MMKTTRSRSDSQPVQSVWRALDVLEAFPKSGPEIGLTALAERLDLNKATAYRLLATLENRGYIERAPDGRKYRLGARTLELGAYFQSQLDVRRLALPYMASMVEQTGEAAFLCVRENDEALCVERVESDQEVNIFILRVGGRQPLHCGGAPRALLTALSDDEIAAYARRTGLPAFTPHTITNLEALLEDVRCTRQQGYLVSLEDASLGIAAIGAPVCDHAGNVFAAISLSGLVARYSPQRIPELACLLADSARNLSRQMGFREDHSP
ncbi:MAG: IclR family transcriptional regulator [Anaerolineales bacterium]|nr:IclR family transcriptional regulator [Anaerolineales bacterium]